MSNHKYKAFISYSHKDAALGEEIHRELEHYKVPRRLVGKTTEVGTVPSRLGQFFRDREELPAAEDLSAEVSKALRQSEFMIVLCSPSAAASRWVNKEIIEFKKIRGDKFVLPLILSGEPWASDTENKEIECFPPALRYRISPAGTVSHIRTEPIAADIRDGADGRKRGLQKVIAGLLGVGLDQLVERELQRKQRRVMAVTSASVLGMVVMGALTYQATTARNAAERHRAEAEDLIEFMLTDLRDKLEPVGRLDVLDAVGGKAVSYYNAQDLDDVSDDAIGRRARAFHMLGEIQNSRGNLQRADDMFRQANAATAGLFERDPSDPQRIYEHAQSIYWVGYQAWQLGDFEGAGTAWNRYLALSQKLVAMEPTHADWQLELAYAYSNIGTLKLNIGEPKAAYENFSKSLAIFYEIDQAQPDTADILLELADGHAWMADALLRFSAVGAVLENRLKERDILTTLLQKDPLNKSTLESLYSPNRALGHLEIFRGNFDVAIQYFQEAQRIGAQLAEADPENIHWINMKGGAHIDLAKAYFYSGALELAKNQLAQADLIAGQVMDSEVISFQKRVRYKLDLQGLKLQVTSSGNVSASQVSGIMETFTENSDDYTALSSSDIGHYAFMRLHIQLIRSALARGNQEEAEELLNKIWQGRSEIGPLTKQAEQTPWRLVALLEIARLRGDTATEETLMEALMERGYSTASYWN